MHLVHKETADLCTTCTELMHLVHWRFVFHATLLR
jgi:hypothetical protein